MTDNSKIEQVVTKLNRVDFVETWESDNSLSDFQKRIMNKIITPKGYKNLLKSRKTLELLIDLPTMNFKDLLIFSVGIVEGRRTSTLITSKVDRATFIPAFKAFQNLVVQNFAKLMAESEDCVFRELSLFMMCDPGGDIYIIPVLSGHMNISGENRDAGGTLIYSYSRRTDDGPRISIVVSNFGTSDESTARKTREQALHLLREEIHHTAVPLYRDRFCYTCGKIGAPGDFKHCECCPKRRYCSEECFRLNWRVHAPEHHALMQARRFSAAVREDATGVGIWEAPSEAPAAAARSRPLEAKRDLSSGSAPERPPPPQSYLRCCDVCGFEPDSDVKLLRCTRCQDRFFCSKDCQRRDWREHKANCKAL